MVELPSVGAAAHAGGIDGSLVLEVAHAAEQLPVGVLQPAFDDGFFAEITGVLEVVKGDQEAGIEGEPACATATDWSDGFFPESQTPVNSI